MKRTGSDKGLTTIVAAVCVVMLALIGVRLYTMLAPTAPADERVPFACEDASDGLPGVVLIDIDDASAAAYYHVSAPGVYVLAVEESSGAYTAGLRSGDRIISANGVSVSASGDLQGDASVGGLTLRLARADDVLTVTIDTGSQI